MTWTYVQGAELPDFTANFRDENKSIIDMSSGWTFGVKVGKQGSAALVTKTTGITGGSDPSVTVQWATSGELNSIAPGKYRLQVTATRTSDSRQRIRWTDIEVESPLS